MIGNRQGAGLASADEFWGIDGWLVYVVASSGCWETRELDESVR